MKFIPFFSILALLSCSKYKPTAELIADSTIVNIQAEYMIIQEENQILHTDLANARKKIDSLYQKYNVTKEQVDSTLNYYRNDINRWKDFYHRVAKRLESMQQKEMSKPNI